MFMQGGIISTDNYKIKTSVNSEHLEDALYYIVVSISVKMHYFA